MVHRFQKYDIVDFLFLILIFFNTDASTLVARTHFMN